MASTLIHGGTLVDVVRGQFFRGQLLLRDGVMAAIGAVPREQIDAADQHYDATGMYVAPGFIDMHTHVFQDGLGADRVGIEHGVACVVDAGSAGADTADAFPSAVIETQQTPAYGLINIGSPGLPGAGGGHASRAEPLSLEATVRAVERHPDWVR